MRTTKRVMKAVLLGMLMFVLVSSTKTAMAAQSPVEIERITYGDLATLRYGTRIIVREGTKYYASADKFDHGPHGTIGNRYTPLGANIYVGGFALLNKNGELMDFRGYNPAEVPISKRWKGKIDSAAWDNIWVAIFLDPKDDSAIGWLPARSIIAINGILGDGKSNKKFRNGIKIIENTKGEDLLPEEIDTALPDPGNAVEDRIIKKHDNGDNNPDEDFLSTREIAYAIEDYEETGKKTALLLDASGSVSDYMSDIADYGNYVEKVNKARAVIAFARKYSLIKAENYLSAYVDNSETDIYSPLNCLSEISHLEISGYDRIIIVTDTEQNVSTTLNAQLAFKGKIIIVCTGELDDIQRDTVTEIEEAFGTTVYLCRLDNELDRARASELLK